MSEPVQSTKWRSFRLVLRVILAVAIAFVLFSWWSMNVGRGFLPQQRRHLFIDGQRQSDGRWTFQKTGSGSEEAPDPPLPSDPTVVRIRMQEESMGRTDLGEWSSWRASNWAVIWMARGDGTRWDLGEGNLSDANMTDALSDYLVGTLIPQSEALAIWSDVPPRSIRRNGAELWWTAWQTKASVTKFVAIIAACILIGVVVASVLVPKRRIKTA